MLQLPTELQEAAAKVKAALPTTTAATAEEPEAVPSVLASGASDALLQAAFGGKYGAYGEVAKPVKPLKPAGPLPVAVEPATTVEKSSASAARAAVAGLAGAAALAVLAF
jgi:hypothetical protein